MENEQRNEIYAAKGWELPEHLENLPNIDARSSFFKLILELENKKGS